MGNGIFISYRRADAQGWARMLRSELVGTFGAERVFLDVESIGLERYADRIHRTLAECAVCLVVIGDRWLEITDAEGNRRLEDQDDDLAGEVEAALASDITVVPVLVDGAAMPSRRQLPERLQDLVSWNAWEIPNNRHTDESIEDLVGNLVAIADAASAQEQADQAPPPAAPDPKATREVLSPARPVPAPRPLAPKQVGGPTPAPRPAEPTQPEPIAEPAPATPLVVDGEPIAPGPGPVQVDDTTGVRLYTPTWRAGPQGPATCCWDPTIERWVPWAVDLRPKPSDPRAGLDPRLPLRSGYGSTLGAATKGLFTQSGKGNVSSEWDEAIGAHVTVFEGRRLVRSKGKAPVMYSWPVPRANEGFATVWDHLVRSWRSWSPTADRWVTWDLEIGRWRRT